MTLSMPIRLTTWSLQYAKDDFRWEDQVRLAEWLAEHPGPVMLSNQRQTES